MSLRLAEGKRLDWIDTRKESGFSNFLFIDQHYSAHPVMRRIFSLARKHEFHSVLIEELASSNCALLASEDEAMAKRQPDFKESIVHRFSFLRSLPERQITSEDFIGSAIFKSDHFGGLPRPRQPVYEAVLPPPRTATANNFIHCGRSYQFHTSIGDFSASGVLYAQ